MTMKTSALGQGSSSAEPQVLKYRSALQWPLHDTEWKSPTRRSLGLLRVIYCEAQLPASCQKFKQINKPFQKTCCLTFFLEPMCQFSVNLKALRGGGPLVTHCAGGLVQQQLLGESVQLNVRIK